MHYYHLKAINVPKAAAVISNVHKCPLAGERLGSWLKEHFKFVSWYVMDPCLTALILE